MKVGRRAVLQFMAGAVGGTLLSPLPWKLTDDAAIWTQNWFWRPSPARGEITRKPTVCALCEGGCGVQARLVDGKRAILLEGNPNHPVNQGGICALGAAGLQFLYAPYRIAQPLKQTKRRGDPTGFQPIAWNEAVGELAKKLGQMRADGKPNGLAGITRRRRSSMDALLNQFFAAYGSPNLFKMPAHADSLKIAGAVTTGREAPFGCNIEDAPYILSFGAGLVEGWGSPGRMQAAFRRWRQGGKSAAKIVQVDSRCSTTAAMADRWIAVPPGTEAALALGIAHLMVKDKLYDAEFMADRVFGFEDWTDSQGKNHKGFKFLVQTDAYTPEAISKVTGVEPARIRELAKEFGTQKGAVAVWGQPQGSVPKDIYNELSFLALNALKGNIKAGGAIGLAPEVPLGALPELPGDPSALKGLKQLRLDLASSQKGPPPVLPGNNLHGFLDAVSNGGKYPIEVMLVHEANPAYGLFENKLFQQALAKIGTLVSLSSYMDETAQQADLILPIHTAFEGFDDVIGIPGAPYAFYGVCAPVLKPHLNTKAAGDIVMSVAKQLGGSIAAALPWASHEEYLKKRAEGLAASARGALADKKGVELWKLQPEEAVKPNYKDGADLWKKLAGGTCWYDAPVDPLKDLKTESGKFELAAQLLLAKGQTGDDDQVYLPHFSLVPPRGSDKDYPLLLVTYQMSALADRDLANPPFMTKTVFDFILRQNDQFVEINPSTASELGMAEGDSAVLKTPQGEVPVRVHLYAGARPKVVYLAQGLGHKAYDEYIKDKGVNANGVVEVQLDRVTGLGTVWAARAHLRRA